MKLNIGSGEHPIEGFENLDIREGQPAFPLPYEENSVDEIRSSHMLEHLSFKEVGEALAEWFRVLKPGGRIRISVPDVIRAMYAREKGDENWRFYLFGGQTYPENFHRSGFDAELLTRYLIVAGFDDVRPWSGDGLDTADHPVSLNLEANKPNTEPLAVKVATILSRPRLGFNDFWDCAMSELPALGMDLGSHKGVFWGQCMERAFESAVARGCDWILTFDYDTLFTRQHIRSLMQWLKRRPDMDAVAALQCRRGKPFPLMTVMEMADESSRGKVVAATVDGAPILATTAHFGLTLLRVESLLRLKEKPWFWSKPDANGGWGEGRLDDDIYFWHQWRKAGNTLYVAPDVRIGHVEETVSQFGEDMKVQYMTVGEWRVKNGLQKPEEDKESLEGITQETV